jgi:hypothetical protein
MRMLPGATGAADAADAMGAAASKRVPEADPCWTSPAPQAVSSAEAQTAAAMRHREVKLRILVMLSPLFLSVARGQM